MKRLVLVAICSFAFVVGATAAFADPPDAIHARGGVGFHNSAAPIGLRWWLSGEKIGLDFGLGLSSTPSAIDVDEKELGWALDFGVPLVMHSWDDVHVLFRPGILYTSQEVGFDSDPGSGFTFDTETATTFSIRAELEAEVFLRNNVSFSASHGLAFDHSDPAFGESSSSFGTFGNNFTNIGFHVYFLGGGGPAR